MYTSLTSIYGRYWEAKLPGDFFDWVLYSGLTTLEVAEEPMLNLEPAKEDDAADLT